VSRCSTGNKLGKDTCILPSLLCWQVSHSRTTPLIIRFSTYLYALTLLFSDKLRPYESADSYLSLLRPLSLYRAALPVVSTVLMQAQAAWGTLEVVLQLAQLTCPITILKLGVPRAVGLVSPSNVSLLVCCPSRAEALKEGQTPTDSVSLLIRHPCLLSHFVSELVRLFSILKFINA
jgi:hypothetical protein